jgi:NAD(P)H-dependent flavin oxidoreductase YrpB (nitropropane dioxygenase family)
MYTQKVREKYSNHRIKSKEALILIWAAGGIYDFRNFQEV